MDAAYAARYRTLWEHHWWWRSRESFVVGRLERLATQGRVGRILDVGCGDGLFFDVLARFGEVDGLEPDARLLSGRERPGRITLGGLDRSFRPDRRFDLALMLDVLEHIEDDHGALVALKTCLNPGGRLLLTVPAHPRLWSRHDEANDHFRRYTARSLAETVRGAGFEVEDLRPFFVWTVAPMLARRWLQPAGRPGRGAGHRVGIPPRPINAALAAVSRAEHALTSRARFPWGGSLYALARAA